jgi:hypothetical protein
MSVNETTVAEKAAQWTEECAKMQKNHRMV